MKIAIQGEAGSFSEDAARQMVPGAKVVACARSAEVFAQIQRGSVAAAVIPIENTLAGSVTEHFDLLLANDVFIQREFRMRIVHNLIASPGVKKSEIRRVYSHPVALVHALSVFALRDISLRKIESRPMRGRPWEYIFYAYYLRGDDEPARNALRHLGEVTDLVKVLGIYPAAKT